jgi:pantetheine-phosphate adenylyltransferase
MKKNVIIGGTFDVLHVGHKSLLKRAFGLGRVTIGLTSNRMAEITKKRKVSNFQSRKRELEKFIKKELKSGFKTIKIEDKFGPTLKEDFDYIVVSPATYKTALLINQKRREIKKKSIKIVKIKFVLAENGKPISASQILKGRMTKEGKSIKKRNK